MDMEPIGYTTWGPVRGDCGHVHRTDEAAEACIRRDHAGCRKVGGYSDRGVKPLRNRAAVGAYRRGAWDVTVGPRYNVLEV